MYRNIAIGLSGIWMVGLVVLGLFAWRHAGDLGRLIGWQQPSLGLWSVRCAGIALISGAQAILLGMVVQRLFRPDPLSSALRLSALFVAMVGVVTAIALGFAGR